MIRGPSVILLTGVAALVLSATVLAQSRPVGTQGAATTGQTTQLAPSVPITFARSGKKTVVWTAAPKDVIAPKVLLRAFGRAWTEPELARPIGVCPGCSAEIAVPAVRVPTVFSVTPDNAPDIELGQVVAYPDRDVEWDKKITLYSCSTPRWFDEWASARGLPVGRIRDLPSDKLTPADEKGKSLLILGPAAAGKDLPDMAKLANDKRANVLILEAGWFGDPAGPASVAPAQMLGGLADIARQQWPQPLKFASRSRPCPDITNRWAWIMDEAGIPLVEQVHRESKGWDSRYHPPIILSYLPWEAQLGRAETADLAFLKMISAAAGMEPPALEKSIGVLWPDPELLPREKALAWIKKHPILSLAPLTLTYPAEITVFVLDLRGDGGPTADEVKALKEKKRWEQTPLLILGDDKMLDEWEWLKLDRAKKTIKRAGVVWLSDDELPSLKDNQIKLMLKLTELGVLLVPPSPEEKQK